MTCLEKYLLDHPGESRIYVLSTCCPHISGGMSQMPAPDNCPHKNGTPECGACWDREIPGTEPIKMNVFPSGTGIAVGKIKDSGERRQFDTGAVRDIQEGKGRCDLMPLDTVGVLMNDGLFYCLAMFQKHGDALSLEESLTIFCEVRQWDKATMFLEVAKHFEDGAKKYGENNWQKGIPVRCYIDSAVRHYLKWLRDDKDEPHDRAFCWNILCAIWTCKHKPELNDYNKEVTEE